jgi:hypothetical protein
MTRLQRFRKLLMLKQQRRRKLATLKQQQRRKPRMLLAPKLQPMRHRLLRLKLPQLPPGLPARDREKI